MNRVFIVLIAATLTACASSDPGSVPGNPRGPEGREGFERSPMARSSAGGLELLPPDRWWQNSRIADAVKLTSEQSVQFDKIAADHGDELIRLDGDSSAAMRELREVVDRPNPTADEIVAAAERVRQVRGKILEQQIQMLAAERVLLSREQWEALRDAIDKARREMRQQRGGNPRGGGYPGGGKRPGWGG